jgi:hypothetical protein
MDKGPELNKRVWSLFERSGFQTQPSSHSNDEYKIELSPYKKIPLDLFAQAPGATIVGSNKSGGLGRWSEHVANYKHLGEKAQADKVLFVVTGTELPEEEKQFVFNQVMSYHSCKQKSGVRYLRETWPGTRVPNTGGLTPWVEYHRVTG